MNLTKENDLVNIIFKRILSSLWTLAGVILISFILLDFVPGSPVYEMIGSRSDKQTIQKLNKKLHIGEPLSVRFFSYCSELITGDWGESFFTGDKVFKEILYRFPKTFFLAFFAMLLASIIGIIAGIITAYYRNSLIEKIIMPITLLGISTPVFWAGIIFILLFSILLHIFPSGGYEDGKWQYLILPIITLGIRPAAFIARLTRTEMVNILFEPYILTAKAKGLTNKVILIKHCLRNVSIPILHLVGMDLGTLMGGAALIEIVFNYPGIGYYGLHAIGQRDYPVILGVVLFSSICFIIINLLVDIGSIFLDPRIRAD